jgi:hypothetical protein
MLDFLTHLPRAYVRTFSRTDTSTKANAWNPLEFDEIGFELVRRSRLWLVSTPSVQYALKFCSYFATFRKSVP